MELLKKHAALIFVAQVLLITQFLLINFVEADIKYYDFVLTETNFTRLCETKHVLAVNGTIPGPVIRAKKGDTVFVNVHNEGYYGVTLHWHGVKQPRNPWSDGPEYITQCPIEAGSNFTYEVILSSEEGTVWWHAHSDWTRFSVYGAIVVYPADGTSYPFQEPDGEEVIVLGTWYKDDVMELLSEALKSGYDTPRSDAYFINGEPGDLCNCSSATTYRRVVDYGKTYLFRMVNGAMNSELFFAIANHSLTVVAVDGSYIKPITTEYVKMSPGTTMDILVTTNQAPGYYYMAAREFSSEEIDVSFDEAVATAILMYSGNYTTPSSPTFPDSLPYYFDFEAGNAFENSIKSLATEEYPSHVPIEINTRMYIAVSMNQIKCGNETCHGLDNTKLSTSLNNVSFTNPTTDVLLAYYRNLSGYYTTDFPDFPPTFYNFTSDDLGDNVSYALQGTKVKELNYNDTVEMVFQGTYVLHGPVNHPMHLHGYSFYVVGRGIGNFDNETDPLKYNLVDPPLVNTFTVPKVGWMAIRFRANNPGVWFWHCHFDRHQSWGMNTAFIVKDGGTPETSMRKPPAYLPPCVDPLNKEILQETTSDELSMKS